MTRLTRITNKVFGATASIADDPLYGPQIGQFGSAKAGTYNATADVATIQGLSAWNNGWIDAVIPNQQYPTLPEMTGFGKVVTYQTGYILQEGIPEWDAGTTYYKESIVKVIPITTSRSATASIGESTGITSASVDLATFITQITIDGDYVFTFDGSNWTYDGVNTNLSIYGITYEGTPANNDTITISLTTIENIGELTLYVSTQDENTNHNPVSSPSYWRLLQLGGGGKNIGETVFSLLPLTDSGLHLLDGSLIVGGSYAQFVSYMENLYNNNPTANYFCSEGDWQTTVTTYGACGKFVVNTVNHTVRLPKVTGMVEGTIDVTALGDLVEAGLPNIIGEIRGAEGIGNQSFGETYVTNQSGALRAILGAQSSCADGPGAYDMIGFSFDASLSNSIYKNNFNKVQPQTIKGFFYLCIANVTKTDIEINIDEIATDLNGKADVDLTNVSNTSGLRRLVEVSPKSILPSWYKVYQEYDKTTGNLIGLWCEQGGFVSGYADSDVTVTYLKAFVNTNYTLLVTPESTSEVPFAQIRHVGAVSKTNTSFITRVNSALDLNKSWLACGYIS